MLNSHVNHNEKKKHESNGWFLKIFGSVTLTEANNAEITGCM